MIAGTLERTFTYTAKDGSALFKERWVTDDGKSFLWYRLDAGQRVKGYGETGGPRVYRRGEAEEALARFPDEIIFYVEGEKKCDLLRASGLTVISSVNGASWTPDDGDLDFLAGAYVVILPDVDAAGLKHANAIARHLAGRALCVVRLDLEGLGLKGDVADWLGGHTGDELLGLAYEALRGALGPEADFWLGPAEYLLREPRYLVRLKTGLKTLDRATRGGIPTGIVTALVGAPRAGKTALASQLAVNAAGDGWLVVVVFMDEGRRAGAVRIGQQAEGLDRAKLEEQLPEELERFLDAMQSRALDIRIPDPDKETLEEIIGKMEREAQGRHVLLVVDSLQSVRSNCGDEASSLREMIEAKMRLLEGAAKRGAAVLVTSEMNRSAYRNKDEKDNIQGIAAGAEGRAIEYVSRLLMVFDGDVEKVVRVKIEKNSPGGVRPFFRLLFDKETALFREISEDDAEALTDDSRRAETKAHRSKVKEKVLKALRGGEKNTRALREEVGGRAALVDDARDELLDDGAILAAVGPRGEKVFSLKGED